MSITDFSLEKRRTPLQAGRIAYYEEGAGALAALLHGCPFSSSIWRRVVSRMSHIFRRWRRICLEIIPAAGHFVMEEQPKGFASLAHISS